MLRSAKTCALDHTRKYEDRVRVNFQGDAHDSVVLQLLNEYACTDPAHDTTLVASPIASHRVAPNGGSAPPVGLVRPLLSGIDVLLLGHYL